MDEIFGVYKTSGPTSNDIVRMVKKIKNEKKVGHAGTLDPLASGVIVIAAGKDATKKISTYVAKEKEYLARIMLGTTSTTDDEEGIKTENKIVKKPLLGEIRNLLNDFEGTIDQLPPTFSAVKVKGKEAYKLARQGKGFTLEPKKVLIKKIELYNYAWPYLEIKVLTGPGAYIRSLARDIGQALKTGAYLTELERTRVGGFTKSNSITFKKLKEQYESSRNRN